MNRTLILASTSVYRRALLERLGLPFTCVAPECDETALPEETPAQQAQRLALAKALAVAHRCDSPAVVIGSDQVASCDGRRFGKPGTVERAIAQLKAQRGREVVFDTAVAVVDTITGKQECVNVSTTVRFRADLTDTEIERYVWREQPLDCAGAAKVEALGISLLECVHSDDPTALIGLPLIATSRLLRLFGFAIP